MSSHGIELRSRIVEAVEEGESKSSVARRFKVGLSTVKRYMKRAQAGCLEAKTASGPKSWLSKEAAEVLRQQVKDHNDWTLEQHAEGLGKSTGLNVKKSAIGKYFKHLKITRKKRAL